MKSNINKKTPINNMNKLFLIFLMVVLGLSSVMGGTLTNINDKDYAINQYFNADISNKYTQFVFGQDNFNFSVNNVTYVYDFNQRINDVNSPIYLIWDNLEPNSEFTIFIQDYSSPFVNGNPQGILYTILIEDVGTYYAELNPKYSGQNMEILFNAPNNWTGDFIMANTLEQEKISLFTPLINGVVDLILINVALWQIMFYLFIGVIIIGSIWGVVLLAYRFYKWANEVDIWTKNKRKNRSNFRK